jgi:hypothetical protein
VPTHQPAARQTPFKANGEPCSTAPPAPGKPARTGPGSGSVPAVGTPSLTRRATGSGQPAPGPSLCVHPKRSPSQNVQSAASGSRPPAPFVVS